MANSFEYFSPTRVIFGKETEKQTGKLIREYGGSRVLVLYGGKSAIRSGLLDLVKESLKEEELYFQELGGIVPNPHLDKVYEGIELIRREKVDFVLAVGGGSAIDSAKAMAHGALYDGDFWDFFCGKAKPEKSLPKGVVLTMSAAGSESSDSCVITQESTKTKRGLNTELNRPLLAIMDPELTMTLPPYQIACGATDILAHIMERYFTNEPDCDLTDRLCEGTMQAVIRAARIMVKDPHDYDAAAQLMWGSTIAHNDTLSVGRVKDFASHQIEHELSALYDCAHGAGLAVVFPGWLRFMLQKPDKVMRLAQFAVRVWGCQMDFEHPEKTAQAGIDAYVAWLKGIGMPVTFGELGAREEDIPYLAAKVKRPNPDGTVGKFYALGTEDIEKIYHLCL